MTHTATQTRFGAMLQRSRREAGLTIEQLANDPKIDGFVSAEQISRYEDSRRSWTPAQMTIVVLSRFFDWDLGLAVLAALHDEWSHEPEFVAFLDSYEAELTARLGEAREFDLTPAGEALAAELVDAEARQ